MGQNQNQQNQIQQRQTAQGQTGTSQTRTGAAENLTGADLVGKQVISSDGRMLGTVAEVNPTEEGSGYVMVKGEGDRVHPVPAGMLEESPQKDRLSADFDQAAFQKSPSFSDAERQQLSDSQLKEVRGYYESGSQNPSTSTTQPGQMSQYQKQQTQQQKGQSQSSGTD